MTVRLIIARPIAGSVGETRRVVHLFPEPTEDTPLDRLVALCRAAFGPGELERLSGIQGMPCEACLRRVPVDDTSDDDVNRRLTAIEGRVNRINLQVDALQQLIVELAVVISERSADAGAGHNTPRVIE